MWKVLAWGVPLEKKTIQKCEKTSGISRYSRPGTSPTIKYSRSICNPGEKIVLK
jgi:hypothetical protein